jgi:hypothetical protein
LAELTQLASAQIEAFEQLDAGQRDELTIRVQYESNSVGASVSSQNNGGFGLKREAGQSLGGFLETLKEKAQKFVTGFLTLEEKTTTVNTRFQTFMTKMDQAILKGNYEVVPDSAKKKADPGSDAGEYTQTAEIKMDGETYVMTRHVQNAGYRTFTISNGQADGKDATAFVAYSVCKNPGGDVAKDQVGNLFMMHSV